jgi:hypothetical protein
LWHLKNAAQIKMPREAKIDRRQYEAAYQLARQVDIGRVRLTDAKAELVKMGLNANSGADFIYILRHMLRGEIYKRAMSAPATEDFLKWIQRDYGEAALAQALKALALHIPFNGGAMNGHRELLARYQATIAPKPEPPTALDDLDAPPTGIGTPDRAKRTMHVFQRDPAVRAHVVKRAQGRCEYCRRQGFLLPNGNHYVEAHHIIALAKQGPDTLENVIALCPEHHREAHFGTEAEKLERGCMERLREILGGQ